MLWLLSACGLLLAVKLYLSASLSLFGDEAFYWWESRHLAWAYSDLPGFTQWMIALSEALFGGSYLGVRALAALAGIAIPCLMVLIAGELGASRRSAWFAGVGFFMVPLANALGLLALPDTWLSAWALGAALCALRAMRTDAMLDFAALGLCLSAGLATHPRFVPWIAAMLPFLLMHPRGRRWLSSRGFWLAALLGLTGLIPTLWFNASYAFENLQFQLLDRHPWRFAWSGLRFFPEQLLLTTPTTVLLLVWILRTARRSSDPRLWLCMSLAISHWLLYALLAPLSDRDRLSAHWTLPSYLLALSALPLLLEDRVRRTRVLIASALSLLFSALLLGVLGMGALRVSPGAQFASKWLPENFIGWREAAGLYRMVQPFAERDTVLVADNFMLAAQLAFELKRPHDLYVLDHPLNAKHGRALQLKIWQRDGKSAAARARSAPILLLAELSATKREAQPNWVAGWCSALGPLDLVADFSLVAERKRVAILQSAAAGCALPALGYVGIEGGEIRGWHLSGGAQVIAFDLFKLSDRAERLLASFAPGEVGLRLAPSVFSAPLPLGSGTLELRARYAKGGVVTLAAAQF